MINVSVHQEDIKNAEMYIPNNKGSKYRKQKLIKLKEEIGKSTSIIKDFNTPLSVIYRIDIKPLST